tara:strand:- start:71 stop:1006 length:936 start_codon:yes stop_codon:yes gene_type:complete
MKLTKNTLKQLIRETITADQIRRRDAARDGSRDGRAGTFHRWRPRPAADHEAYMRAYNKAKKAATSDASDASLEAARWADRKRFAQGGLPELGGRGLADPDAWGAGDPTRLYDAGPAGVSRPTAPPPPATLGGGAGVNITADNARTQINDLHVSGKIDRETKVAARRALYTPEGEYDPVAGLQASKEILRSVGVTVNESKQRFTKNTLKQMIRETIASGDYAAEFSESDVRPIGDRMYTFEGDDGITYYSDMRPDSLSAKTVRLAAKDEDRQGSTISQFITMLLSRHDELHDTEGDEPPASLEAEQGHEEY